MKKLLLLSMLLLTSCSATDSHHYTIYCNGYKCVNTTDVTEMPSDKKVKSVTGFSVGASTHYHYIVVWAY